MKPRVHPRRRVPKPDLAPGLFLLVTPLHEGARAASCGALDTADLADLRRFAAGHPGSKLDARAGR